MKNEVDRTLDSLIKQINILVAAKSPSNSHFQPKKLKSNTIERISKDIDKIYHWFFGDVDKTPNEKNKQRCIAKIINHETNLFLLLIQSMEYLDFNDAKLISQVIKDMIKNCKINKCDHYVKSITDINGYNPIIQCLFDQLIIHYLCLYIPI